jgi:hypothetical protein
MSAESLEYQRTAIRPVDCLKASKELLGDQYWLFLGIAVVGILIASAVPFGILMGPMMCGIYYCYFRRMRGESVEFGMLFKGFDYFVESLLATLMLVGLTLVLTLPLCGLLFGGIMALAAAAGPQGHGGGEPPLFALFGMMGIFYVAILLVSLIAMVFFAFAYPLILDRGMKAWPAVCTSCRAAWANFGGMLGLMCLLMLISVVASLCCYVPALLFMPFYMGALAVAYRKVFPETSGPAA